MTLPTPTTPYGSAADLPSMKELLQQIRGAKALTLVIARDQRAGIIDAERQAIDICSQVDAFYALLGPRNWIYTDAFQVETIRDLLDLPPDRAEKALIAWYKEPDTLRFGVMRLTGAPALRVRLHQIEQAREDYAAGRYYAAIQGLLSVMDGFVNDVEPHRRKGIHAREPEELQAWDSVVGHHLGLAHAHASFTRTFKKTVTEEVFELHRHGIVHGTIVTFDNDVVATKAWNRLFAVADWANSLEKAAAPKAEQKPWGVLMRELSENARALKDQRAALDAWQASVLTPEDPAFLDDEVVARSIEYLDAWSHRNFGRAASMLCPLTAEETHGRTAGRVKDELSMYVLSEYLIESVLHTAPAATDVDVIIVTNGERTEARMRWIRTDETGTVATPNVPGTWGLTLWGPASMIGYRERAAS